MKDYLFLKILDRFKFLIPKSVDYISLRSVLQLKMTLDSRTSTSALQYANNRRKKRQLKDENRKTNRNVYTIIIYLIIGAFLTALIALPISSAEVAGLILSVFMVFIGTRILSVFSTVLIDTKDRKILLSKPLNKKTIGFARNLYATYYITLMSFAIMIIPIIVYSIVYGVQYGLLLFADMILTDFFLIALVALLYYYVLKFFDGEKLKNAIMVIQVLLGAIVIILTHAEYIIGPLALKIKNMPFHMWYFFIPSYWFSTSFNLLDGAFSEINIIGTILSFAIPIVLIVGYILVIDRFEGYLEKLDMASEGKSHKKTTLKNLIPSIICRTKEERAFYDFSIHMMKNEEIFKSKLYTQMIQSIISPFIIIFAITQNMSFNEIRHGYWYLTLYLGSASVASLVYMIKYSNSYKAAWIYHITPLQNLNSAYSGALKAFFIRIILPVLIFFSIIIITIWGVSYIPQALCLICITIIGIAISYKYSTTSLPFTVSFADRPKGSKGRGYIILLISLVGAILQFVFSYFIPFGNYIFLIIIVISTIIIWNIVFSKKEKNLVEI